MNAVRINSSPFKGEVGRGMGLSGGYFVDQTAVAPHPHPIPPLEGEGEAVHAIALGAEWCNVTEGALHSLRSHCTKQTFRERHHADAYLLGSV